MKFTEEEKQQMLEEVLKHGKTIRSVADNHGINYINFTRLFTRARLHGIENVLHRNKKRGYTVDFKLEVVRSVQNGSSKTNASNVFNISHTLEDSWCAKYVEKGIEGLSIVRRQKILKEDRPEADSPKSKKRRHTEKEYQELEKRLSVRVR